MKLQFNLEIDRKLLTHFKTQTVQGDIIMSAKGNNSDQMSYT